MSGSVRPAAVVTGGGRGIGAAICRMADARGYRVGVLDVDGDAAASVAASLDGGVALPAAVNDEAAVTEALDRFTATAGVPALAVNNAGIVRFGPLADLSVEDWRDTVDVNLTGTFVVGRAAAVRMAAAGRGAIVNLTSINGVSPGPYAGAYGSTKAAIALLTAQMAIEFGPAGVRVNAVAPGLIDGGMSEPIYADAEIREARAAKVPLGTPGHRGRHRTRGPVARLRRGRLRDRPEPGGRRRRGDVHDRQPAPTPLRGQRGPGHVRRPGRRVNAP